MWKSAQLRDKCKTTGAETLPETIGKHNENEGWHARETNKVRNIKKQEICEKEQKVWERATKYEN